MTDQGVAHHSGGQDSSVWGRFPSSGRLNTSFPSSLATGSDNGLYPPPSTNKKNRGKSLNAQQRALALNLYVQRKHTVEEICRTLGISKPTLYTYVRGESSSSKP